MPGITIRLYSVDGETFKEYNHFVNGINLPNLPITAGLPEVIGTPYFARIFVSEGKFVFEGKRIYANYFESLKCWTTDNFQ